MVEKRNMVCPFCNHEGVESLYTPPYINLVVKRDATGAKTKRVKISEKYEIISGCSNCGKTKKEINKALKEGTPEQKAKRKKRYKELDELRLMLQKKKESSEHKSIPI